MMDKATYRAIRPKILINSSHPCAVAIATPIGLPAPMIFATPSNVLNAKLLIGKTSSKT